jgi:hypothetical protein
VAPRTVKAVVDIVANGPGGSVIYREGDRRHEFGWDLGTGDVLATIYVPSTGDWDAKVPWAAGRRQEILDFIARQVRRRRAFGSRIEMHERWIQFTEPPPWPVGLFRWLIGRARRRTP